MDFLNLFKDKRKTRKDYGQGFTRQEIKDKLGVSYQAIDRQLSNAKRDGFLEVGFEKRKVFRLKL